jgi:hypothetical protein
LPTFVGDFALSFQPVRLLTVIALEADLVALPLVAVTLMVPLCTIVPLQPVVPPEAVTVAPPPVNSHFVTWLAVGPATVQVAVAPRVTDAGQLSWTTRTGPGGCARLDMGHMGGDTVFRDTCPKAVVLPGATPRIVVPDTVAMAVFCELKIVLEVTS